MNLEPTAALPRESPLWGCIVLVGAALLGLCSARDYAGSWNDGSRLAAVESLVDRHTFAIDRSIFVEVPPDAGARGQAPYTPTDADLLKNGTRDKLLIRGHFYSDKPAVISLLMAGLYQVWEWCGGPTAAQRPDLFCYIMTAETSAAAYALAVWCMFRLWRRLRIAPPLRLALTASFALATVALTYSRQVNSHILFLGVAAALMLNLVALAQETRASRPSRLRLLLLGTLAGLGYNLDLGIGPVLLACGLLLVVYRCRRFAPVALLVAAVLPWLIAHHILNYAIGGTFVPMNTVPEYSAWPGGPFNTSNLTGFLRHDPVQFLHYSAELLYGKHGFLIHNLPLLLLLPALGLAPRLAKVRAEAVFAFCWCAGTWLMYALFSNNYGGVCCSIRWFVPLLAPAYYLLALFLQGRPSFRADFYVLSAWGALLAAFMWPAGPWTLHVIPYLWPIQAAALASWLVCRIWLRRLSRAHMEACAADSAQLAQAARAA